MPDRTLEDSRDTNSRSPAPPPREGRNVWILTAYGISGLVLLGVLIYYFSSYITQ
jgi:hypothetical protein